MSDEKKNGDDEVVIEVGDVTITTDPPSIEDVAKGGFLVKVSIKDLPGEVKVFGPYPTDTEANQIAEAIYQGTVVINYFLTPNALDGVFVEPVSLPNGENN